MPATPGELRVGEAVRRARSAIWTHCGALVAPVLAIAAVDLAIAYVADASGAHWLNLASGIPYACLAVAWHRTLLLGRPLTLDTLWRWTPAHWVFFGSTLLVGLAHQVGTGVSKVVLSNPLWAPFLIDFPGFLLLMYGVARLSVLLPAWAIGDERYQTPAAAWRLTRDHGVELVFMSLLAMLWLLLLMLPVVVVVCSQMTTQKVPVAPGMWQSVALVLTSTVPMMVGVGALSYAYRDLTATEAEPDGVGTAIGVVESGGSPSGS